MEGAKLLYLLNFEVLKCHILMCGEFEKTAFFLMSYKPKLCDGHWQYTVYCTDWCYLKDVLS